ncbi:penicillin-binding transpeptidase domain-containing protein [uncultured Oscillibacter sp.]|uniref:penicillin-binding transpeptidase domain-containing protein n=1 Tax=uncultured Oscillibacter sp. TaxID=876091 RepID=UPI0026027045|nr:penicillin-binding transpeptidase domain-containing protein [uncultured Oscillibacter sp.]
MDRKEMQNTRLYLLAALLVLALTAYLFVLYDVQVIHHDDYAAQAIRSIVRPEKVEASRGIITDRNGKPLVSNRSTYDLTFDADLLRPGDDSNEAILRLVQLCQREGMAWSDNLPVSRTAPYRYTVDQLDGQQKKLFLAYLKSLKPCAEALGQYLIRNPDAVSAPEPEPEEGEEPVPVEELSPRKRAELLLERLTPADLSAELLTDAGITPAKLMTEMRSELDIPEDYTLGQARMVLGVQYELSVRKLDNYAAYVLAQDIDTPFISLLSDGNYAGAKVTLSSVREYETTSAAHILGYVGKIGIEDDYPSLKEKGYDYDDLIGKDGAELAFEDYLKGKDGRRMVATNDEGKVTGEYYYTEPEPGNIVELTIDLDFQSQVEGFLEETVTRLNADGDEKRGAGAAVVQVGTGEVLALASYPSYDLSTWREDFAQLNADPRTPMYNRAAMNGYPPGSTLKPFTAMAGLLSGKITLTEKIRDTGKWVYPKDENSYSFCWKHSGHGLLNVTGAITNSCNYFFSELGYRMQMDGLREYLVQFGLGEKTGIEIPETAGLLPENPQGQDQAPWAAYGQGSQLYSPLQLANYIATLVSGGKHCQAHLLKAAKAYDNSEVVAVGNTEPLNEIDISDENLRAVKEGMKGLVEGTLSPYFSRCVVSAGAKTGTSQVRADTKNHGVFVCFAPYDDPEIAVAIAIERADAGAALASTAVNILNAYFTPAEDTTAVTGENQLLP